MWRVCVEREEGSERREQHFNRESNQREPDTLVEEEQLRLLRWHQRLCGKEITEKEQQHQRLQRPQQQETSPQGWKEEDVQASPSLGLVMSSSAERPNDELGKEGRNINISPGKAHRDLRRRRRRPRRVKVK